MTDPEYTDWLLEPMDGWSTVDRWWTPIPERKSWLTVRAPSGRSVVICWDATTEVWSLSEEKGMNDD
jgi:hypothetical protein